MTPLSALGARLRLFGLSPPALSKWAGTERLSALPHILPDLMLTLAPPNPMLALFVAGQDIAVTEAVFDVDEAQRHGLVEVAGDRVHARVALLPLGLSLVVCDRLDTDDSLDIVCWPDDSSYHLALSLPPEQQKRWLDLGCGSAFAPLLRHELAPEITASDLNTRALRYANLGCELSGIGHITVVHADVGDGVPHELRGQCGLVSCNAPIPELGEAPYRARWRLTDTTFIKRLFTQARTFAAPDGMVVVHAALDALEPVLAELTGHRVIVTYTPEGIRGFAIGWWRPDGEDRLVRAHRPLTASRPHLTHEDRLGAMTRTLGPG